MAVGHNRLATAVGAVDIDSLGIPLPDHMPLVVVVIVDSMVTRRCPIVQNISGSKLMVPIAISPASIA